MLDESEETPVMRAAREAAAKVAAWSESKREWARRIASQGSFRKSDESASR